MKAFEFFYPTVNSNSDASIEIPFILANEFFNSVFDDGTSDQSLTSFLANAGDGFFPPIYHNQPNGQDDFADFWSYEYKDDYNLFNGGVLDLGEFPTITLPFDFIHVDFEFGIRLIHQGDDPDNNIGNTLIGKTVTAKLLDQDGNTIRNNAGVEITDSITLTLNSTERIELTTKVNGNFAPLALDGTTGWTTSDALTPLSAPSSPNTANNTNGIKKIFVKLELPNANKHNSFGSFEIYTMGTGFYPDDIPLSYNYGNRGFSFTPLWISGQDSTPFWTPVDIW